MSEPTLTKKTDVAKVLELGGYAVTHRQDNGHGFGIALLFNAQGRAVPAWQQAITANLRPSQCIVQRDESTGRTVWRLKA